MASSENTDGHRNYQNSKHIEFKDVEIHGELTFVSGE
jgi:hypothetical protein